MTWCKGLLRGLAQGQLPKVRHDLGYSGGYLLCGVQIPMSIKDCMGSKLNTRARDRARGHGQVPIRVNTGGTGSFIMHPAEHPLCGFKIHTQETPQVGFSPKHR